MTNETKQMTSDDRLKKSAAEAVRGDRASADAERTEKDGTAMTAAERRAMLRAEWQSDILPTPPENPGWHYCWLSTTNSSDPIYKRLQKGYELVKASEIPGFRQYRVAEGEYTDLIACNEMILAKIPEDLYQEIMTYLHHELPNEEEEILRANAKQGLDGQDSNGRDLGSVEGFTAPPRKTRNPTFA